MSVIQINEETVAVIEVAEQGPPGINGTGGPGGAVNSVNGQTGNVVLTTTHIAEGSNQYHTSARVLAVLLTGLSLATGTAITAADSILSAFGKLQAQISAIAVSLSGYLTPSGAATLTNKTISGENNTLSSIPQSAVVNLTSDLTLKADLVGGKVPSDQLPSFVDDVIEAANFAALPGTGETGKIYVTLADNKTYRWSGSAYVEISASPGSTDAVTEGATNLYFTGARVLATVLTGLAAGTNSAISAADSVIVALAKLQSQIANRAAAIHGHAIGDVTGLQSALDGKENLISAGTTTQYFRGDKTFQTLDKAAVGLDQADNTSDANKPVSTATQTALNAKENTVTPGTTTQYWRGDKTWQTLNAAALSGLGTGIATFLATPSTANLAAAVTGETGTGALVFGTAPAISAMTISVAAAVTAGTNAQGQVPLTSDFNVITTATNNPSGVTLPTATVGRSVRIVNRGANPVSVFPATGASIDGGTANAAVTLPVGAWRDFTASTTTAWQSSASMFNSPVLVTPALGTPASGVLTNCTGLPISTGVAGLAANVATFLATPTSANLAAAVTDEVGTGGLLFNNPVINRQTGTSYTLAASDNGAVVYLDNASAITLTVPSGLGTGFNCVVIQQGAGQVTITAGAGVTLRNRNGLKTAGQWAVASILPTNTADTLLVSGDTAA